MSERKPYEELEQLLTPELQKLARMISAQLPEEWGFGLLVFPVNDSDQKQSVLYVSSALRESMIEPVEKLLEKWKAALAHDEQHAPKGNGG